MPHYATWGGTYVTRPVAREDRSPTQSDGDFNDVVFHSKQADGFMKLGDIRGEFSPSRNTFYGGTIFDLKDVGSGLRGQGSSGDTVTSGDGTDLIGSNGESGFASWQDVRDHNHGNRTNWDVICDVRTSIKQTSVADALTNYRLTGIETGSGDDHITTGLGVRPGNDTINVQSGADNFNCDDILLGHGVTYRLKDVVITSFDNADALTNYNPGKVASYNPGKPIPARAQQGDGSIIIESIVNQDNMQGLDAGGMNYAEAVGLDSSIFDVVNNIGASVPMGYPI